MPISNKTHPIEPTSFSSAIATCRPLIIAHQLRIHSGYDTPNSPSAPNLIAPGALVSRHLVVPGTQRERERGRVNSASPLL